MFNNAIQTFKASISPPKTRIESLSPLILVFGGAASDINNKYASCRSVFLDWAFSSSYDLSKYLIKPEDYKEWNQFEGYDNLVDFERDAGCLSRGILLFSECEGALAELGAFCMDDVLCERLLVVVAKDHYDAPSFIKLGPIRRIEEAHSSSAICVVDSTSDPKLFEPEVVGVGEALKAKVVTLPKTHRFNSNSTRDQFLLIADLVELFGALTKKEIEELLLFMGIEHEAKRLKRMLNLLQLLDLIVESGHLTERYFVPPKERIRFFDYSAPEEAKSKFERSRFKLTTALPALSKEAVRSKAYAKIHGEIKWV
ncbi:retron St85 family effector protein [Ferriphaselus sp. R-1]|uniref:retron St85 family effector protein n=1 Tax=Ferriphaselus sp. R-1 TaxID=1485544 RepID=UPI0012697A79|nr:retron St85 family effector protein [Ferriphaselus sp. R-1]